MVGVGSRVGAGELAWQAAREKIRHRQARVTRLDLTVNGMNGIQAQQGYYIVHLEQT
jgi:hypothetical protein